MPSNQTKNYQLNQWEPEDQVLRTDFNKDNEKIDAAIKAVDVRADGLAQSKADVSALETVKQTLSQHTADLARLGNCQIESFTYTGTNASGASNPTRINFPSGKPLFFVVFGEDVHGIGSRLASKIWTVNEDVARVYSGGWSGNSFSFYTSRVDYQMNRGDETYYVIAFYD